MRRQASPKAALFNRGLATAIFRGDVDFDRQRAKRSIQYLPTSPAKHAAPLPTIVRRGTLFGSEGQAKGLRPAPFVVFHWDAMVRDGLCPQALLKPGSRSACKFCYQLFPKAAYQSG